MSFPQFWRTPGLDVILDKPSSLTDTYLGAGISGFLEEVSYKMDSAISCLIRKMGADTLRLPDHLYRKRGIN
jgi:hypothetical protein